MLSNLFQSKAKYVVFGFTGLFLMFIGLVLGRIVSIGDVRFGILFFGSIFGVVLLGMPNTIVWLCIVTTYLICGPIVYNIPGLDSVWWGAYVLGGILFIPAFFQLITSGNTSRINMGIGMPIFLFAMLFVMTALLNWIPPMQLLVSVKVWLLLAGVFVYLTMVHLDEKTVFLWLKIIFGIALIQIIPVLYQSFFVKASLVALGASTSSADTVVGTFGGSPTSGGMTGALAAFLVFNLMMFLAFVRYKVIQKRVWLYLTLLVLPMLFIEVKALFIYLPVALFVLYKDLAIKNPMRFLKLSFMGAAAMLVMLFVYQAYHWSSKGGDMSQNMMKMFAYSFQSEVGNAKQEEGVMTRVEVLTFWWDKQTAINPIPILFGHGPSASKTGGLEKGTIAKKYVPRDIDRTGLALILWDFGIFGLLLISWLFWRLFRLAGRLVRILQAEHLKAMAHGLQTIVPLFFLAILYRNDLPYAPPMMLSFMITMGLLAWLSRVAAVQYARQIPSSTK